MIITKDVEQDLVDAFTGKHHKEIWHHYWAGLDAPVTQEEARKLAKSMRRDLAGDEIRLHDQGEAKGKYVLAFHHKVRFDRIFFACDTLAHLSQVVGWLRETGYDQPIPSCRKHGWFEDYPVHPAAELFPMVSDDELQGMAEDIKKNKQDEAIKILRAKLVDGRNRLRACTLAGVLPKFEWLPDDTDAVTYVLSKNLHRRHLTNEQKRQVIAAVLKQNPKQNDREIGRKVKADGKTVTSVRKELERRAEIPHVEKRQDSKGRQQPSTKSKPAANGKRQTTAAQAEDKRPCQGQADRESLKEEILAMIAEAQKELHKSMAAMSRSFVMERLEMVRRAVLRLHDNA